MIRLQVDSWTLNLISSYFMTTSSDSWPETLTKSVVNQISRYRKERGLSYQQLADRCTALGYPTIRTTLANLEAHKRKSLTLHELIILAAALEVPPVLLMFPGIPDGEIQILPNKTQKAWDALKWFTGETKVPKAASQPGDPEYPLTLMRELDSIPHQIAQLKADFHETKQQYDAAMEAANQEGSSAEETKTVFMYGSWLQRADAAVSDLRAAEAIIKEKLSNDGFTINGLKDTTHEEKS